MKKRLVFLPLFCLMLLLFACGRNEELDTYKENMERFFSVIAEYDANINEIDPMAEDAEEVLLQNLDGMEGAFTEMATYTVPEEFSVLGNLPGEAADYMTRAVQKYHAAYDNEFSADAETEAAELYEKANRRLQYMIQILHGEIPEGEDVEFVEE